MILKNLFPHLKGHSVLHGSPGYPTPEVIKSIRTDRIKDTFLTLEFESGKFAFIHKKDFDRWLEEGDISYFRATDSSTPEVLIDIEP
jgi:hypothetical protein